MFDRSYFKCCLLIFSLLLTACSQEPKEVTFVAKKGDEARYWISSQTQIEVKGYRERISSEILAHYRVEEVKDNLKLHMSMESLNYNFAGQRFNNVKASAGNRKFQQLFSKGFDITVNQHTGELIDIKGGDLKLWREVVEQGGEVFKEAMKKNVASPGVMKAIPTKVGTVIDLPYFNEQPAKLTVQSVTDKHLTFTIESISTQPAQLYAQVKLHRHNGWLDEMVLTSKAVIETMGQQATVTTVVAVTPPDSPPREIWAFDTWDDYDDEWYDLQPVSVEEVVTPPHKVVSSEDLFQVKTGIVKKDQRDNTYELGMFHRIDSFDNGGLIKLHSIRALDSHDKELGVNFATLFTTYSPNETEPFIFKRVSVTPLGWDKQQELQKLHTVRATADYFERDITAHSINWQTLQDKGAVVGGVKLQLIPNPEKPYEYTLNYNDSENDWLTTHVIAGVEGQATNPQSQLTLPDWLTVAQRKFFERMNINIHKKTWSVKLKLSNDPSEVTFFVVHKAQKPIFSQPIEFVTEESFIAAPNIPPLIEMTWNKPDNPVTAFQFDSLQPEVVMGQGIKLTLPKEWNDVCHIYVENKASINDIPLVWRPGWLSFEYNESMIRSEDRYLAVENRLMTDDGAQLYFYDLDVISRIQCDTEPQWQKLKYQPDSGQPWLISIHELGVKPDDSIDFLLDNYRFYNQQGDALVLLDTQGNTVMEAQGSVSQLLHDGQFIKAAGKVSVINKLQQIEKQQQKAWRFHFPALPE